MSKLTTGGPYWPNIYTYSEMDILLVEDRLEGTSQVITKQAILNNASSVNDELGFLFKLESVARLIYSKECINHQRTKKSLTKKVAYKKDFKALIRELAKGSWHFKNLSISSVGRLEGKQFSPFVEVMVAEVDGLRGIPPSTSIHESMDDLPLENIVNKIEQRLKIEFQGKIRDLENGINYQVSSYFNYIAYLANSYGDLRWIKVSLHTDFTDTQTNSERLNLIGRLSRKFCKKMKVDKRFLALYVGYICSLNTMSDSNPYADIVMFFDAGCCPNFDFKIMQSQIVMLWRSHFTSQLIGEVIFKCSLKPYADPECTRIKKQSGAFRLPKGFASIVVNLVARHQFIAPKSKLSKRLKLVTRGEKPRSAGLRRAKP